ncbi:hypothetical protein TWF696_006636 [Orbilia brochopaga]|uniref:Uncharacterized protein n=1 Tax=Orbilia brochopaga TaxID=3140254 RepID=A0AAV9UPB4_9PEZI
MFDADQRRKAQAGGSSAAPSLQASALPRNSSGGFNLMLGAGQMGPSLKQRLEKVS